MTDPRTKGDQPQPQTDDANLEQYESDEGLDLQRLHAETRRKPYPFRWADRWWELPHPQDLPDNVYDAFSGLADLDDSADDRDLSAEDVNAVRSALHLAFGKRQWAQLNEIEPLPLSAQFTLFNRWMLWAGADVGEASSSAASSDGTAGRSKRTSRGSTASASARRSLAVRKNATRRVKSSA